MTYNSLSQDTELELINRLSAFLTKRSFIDVGAEKGVFSKAMIELGMSGVLFEPMIRHRAGLQQLVAAHSNSALYTCAITDIDTKQIFNIATDASGNELDYYHSLQKANAPGVFSHNKTFEVECRSLQSLADRREIPFEIGILKTDTEGNDLNVLRGLGALRPELVVCEYFTEGLYGGWTEAKPEPIIELMNRLGYQSYIATKRIGGLEFIGVDVITYGKRQWGNLFFFRADFYEKAKTMVSEIVQNNENKLAEQFSRVFAELEEKEKVIQELLLQRAGAVGHSAFWQRLMSGISRLIRRDQR